MRLRRLFSHQSGFIALLTSVLLLACIPSLAGTKKPPPHPINLNTATALELQQVPGIGPATADKILTMRKSYGPFKSVDDLRAIKGIGPKRLEKMRKYLTVGKAPVPKRSQSTSGAESNTVTPPNSSTKKPT